jgi:hypothetical protein
MTVITNIHQRSLFCSGVHAVNTLVTCFPDIHYNSLSFRFSMSLCWGMCWHSQLRHCATSRKVADSIPDGVIGIFHWHNPFNCTTDWTSNRNKYQEYFLGGTVGHCTGLTTLQPSCADCHEIWEPQPPGSIRAWSSLNRDCCTFTSLCYKPAILNALFISVLFTVFVVWNVKNICHFLPLISQSLIRSVCKRFLKQVYFCACSALWILFYQLMMLCNSNTVKVKVSRNGKTPNLISTVSCVYNLIHLFIGMCTSCK